MSRKYKILCSIAGLIIVVSIACMVFLDGVRNQPNPAGILLLVVGIVFWMFILARGFGLYDGDGDSGCEIDTLNETEILPSKIHPPPPPESPHPSPPE
jgi:hypothetical protein